MHDLRTPARSVLAVLAVLALFAGPARALTLEALFELPDESRFAYLVGLSDGIAAGQDSIAVRNQLAACIADMGFAALLGEIEARVSREPTLLKMDVSMVARTVVDARCDAT